jgi:hypothetical protein
MPTAALKKRKILANAGRQGIPLDGVIALLTYEIGSASKDKLGVHRRAW